MMKALLCAGLSIACLTGGGEEGGSRKESAPWEPTASVEFLLSQQREDGSWPGNRDDKPDANQPWSVVATAAACMALLDYRDAVPDQIDPALDRGIRACARKAEKVKAEHWSYIWSQVFALRMLARVIPDPRFKDRAEELGASARAIVRNVYKSRRTSGFWGYGGAGTAFQTAEVLLALLEIKEAGVEVDPEPIGKGLDRLASLRTDDKGYIIAPGANFKKGWEALSRDRALDRSAGRDTLCDWVLFRYGKLPREKLDATLRAFIEHKGFLLEARANLSDSAKSRRRFLTEFDSPYGHFALYAYHYAAFALGDASAGTRGTCAAPLKDDLLGIREPEGSWRQLVKGNPIDHGLASRSYATAMVLTALKRFDSAGKK